MTQTFPAPVYAISPLGEIAGTAGGIYDGATGNALYTWTPSRPVQAITTDYARLVYFDAIVRTLRTIDLPGTLGTAALGFATYPALGSLVASPGYLQWTPQVGIDRYHVYLSTSSVAVGSAVPGSPEDLGEVVGTRRALPAPLTPGAVYYWRVDTVDGVTVMPGTIQSFTVSLVGVNKTQVQAGTVRGHVNQTATLDLTSLATDGHPVAWTAAASQLRGLHLGPAVARRRPHWTYILMPAHCPWA